MQTSDDLQAFYDGAGDPNAVALPTLELRHPAFLDEQGNNIAIRVVCDNEPLEATLEATAPMNAGETVTFQPGAIEVTLPDQGSSGAQKAKIEVDNVTAYLTDHIEAAAASPAPVEMTFREYLSSDVTKPGLIFDGWEIKKITTTLMRTSAEAGFEDFYNKPFCSEIFTPEEFPGLDR